MKKNTVYEKPQKTLNIPKVLLIGGLIIVQTLVFFFVFVKGLYSFENIIWIWLITVIVFGIYIINTDDDPDTKLSWIILEGVFPVFGVTLYFLTHLSPQKRTFTDLLRKRKQLLTDYSTQNEEVINDLKTIDKHKYTVAKYLEDMDFSAYKNTKLEYFEIGEDMFEDIFSEIKKAEKFIFLEFFLLSPGRILDKLCNLLEEKIKEGVEVKFIYDGTNSFFLNEEEFERFKEIGVECKEFLPIKGFFTMVHNSRDHRKIIVIDNKIAYTGGINLADEYANLYEKNGHWIDTGIKLKGEAVESFTLMFIKMWNLRNTEDIYSKYFENKITYEEEDSILIPFSENPYIEGSLSEDIYIDIINTATDYVYITSPYLAITEKMRSALKLASKRGVNVSLLMPHKGDHFGIPLTVGRSYYPELMECGVNLYEYEPGFIHAKSIVSDDETTIVGTINLDYRSLYLHFEDGVLIYDQEFSKKVRNHLEKIIEESILMTKKEYKNFSLISRILGKILRLFAPLI